MIANCQAGNILLIAYSFSCDSFDCELWRKNLQFAIKESHNQNPTYGIRSYYTQKRKRSLTYGIRSYYTQKRKRSFLRAYARVCVRALRACLRAALIKTQNAFVRKIFQHSNALWVQKLSGCIIGGNTRTLRSGLFSPVQIHSVRVLVGLSVAENVGSSYRICSTHPLFAEVLPSYNLVPVLGAHSTLQLCRKLHT